ncbi:hypothetical protein [Siminovitchia terrae]|uniref:hypothetical protein n=1 Tax=Siminovitchia terrae TaxID=1914933 RepID=UPI001BB3D8BF|nr:hypothetical protein [Siminovitchia terrae]
MNWWYETYKKGAAEFNTGKNILNSLEIVIKNIGYVKLSNLDKPSYRRFINKIAPNYTKSTLQRMNTTIREAFLDSMDVGLIHSNPTSRTKYPTTAKNQKEKKKSF